MIFVALKRVAISCKLRGQLCFPHFQEYRIASSRKDLDFTIRLLENISVLTENFMRQKPITSACDPIFEENRKAISFFKDWEAATRHDPR